MSYPVQVIIAATIIISITGGILAALYAVSLLFPPVNWEAVRSTLRTFAQDGDVEFCDLCGDEAGAVYALRNLLTRDDANRCYRSKGA